MVPTNAELAKENVTVKIRIYFIINYGFVGLRYNINQNMTIKIKGLSAIIMERILETGFPVQFVQVGDGLYLWIVNFML